MDRLATTQKLFFSYFPMIFPLSIWLKRGILDLQWKKKKQLIFSLNLNNCRILRILEGLALFFWAIFHIHVFQISLCREMCFGNQNFSWRTSLEGLVLPTTRVIHREDEGRVSPGWEFLFHELMLLREEHVHSFKLKYSWFTMLY